MDERDAVNTVWTSVDELLKELSNPRYIETEYMGKKFRFAWKELPDDEMFNVIDAKAFSEMSEIEREKASARASEIMFIKMINAAGEQKDCTENNVITIEKWVKIPMRIRVQLINQIMNATTAFSKDFLPQSKKI